MSGALHRILLGLVFGLILAVGASAREEIRAFAADVTLRTDGSVAISETIDVNAEGNAIRRGIYRDIPTVVLSPGGGKIRSGLSVANVTRDGEDEPFRTERMGNFVRIWIGDSEQFIANGLHRYVVTYTMSRMGRSFADHDELYWNATGNYWNFPIVKSVARVTLPAGAVISDLVGYTGVAGSTEQAVTITRTSDNSAIFRTGRSLLPGEGMSFAVKFQKGILVAPTGTDALWQWLSDLREVILPVLAVLLMLGYNLLAWSAVGRDPAKGVIIPLFHAPKGFSPALTHYVHHWGFAKSGWTAFTAAIFDLGVKGLVSIKNPDQTLTVTTTGKAPETTLPAGEAALYAYFDREGSVTIDKSNGTELGKTRQKFVSAIETENSARWFRKNAGYAVFGAVLAIAALAAMVMFDVLQPVWLIVAVVAGVMIGVFGTAIGSVWKGSLVSKFLGVVWIGIIGFNFAGFAIESLTEISINTAAIAAGSIVLITVVFAVLMRAPTIQGRKVMDQIDGLKLYLDTAEKDRMNITGEPPMTIERFERLLPYAIALGVEKPWSEHFEGELARNAVSDATGSSYSPRWYSSPSGFSTGGVSNAVAAATTGMAAAMVAAQPVQASSSGFSSGGGGGGSSGGGGGGGGGGGW